MQKAFHVYTMDVVTLVMKGVSLEIDPLRQDQDPIIRNQATRRRNALEFWRKQDHPLAFGENAYAQLTRAVQADAESLSQGLPSSNHSQKSLSWFADQILLSIETNGARIKPPFWRSGRALPVFKVVLREAERLLGKTIADGPTRKLILDFFTKAAFLAKISNIPWSPSHTGFVGRPITTVTHTVWMSLGQASTIPRVLHQDDEAVALQQATQQAISVDTRADWSSIDLTIKDLHTIMNRQCLPNEWDIDSMTWPASADNAYVKQTYIWVRDTFDGNLPLHKLALCIGVIFSKLLPNICHSGKPGTIDPTSHSSHHVRSAPWVPTTSTTRKGNKSAQPFIIMMTTFIIAIYEENSPLRAYMAANKASLGTGWTQKHSMRLFLISGNF